MSGLIVENLGLRRGDREVLSDVSFRADPGEFIALIGPNGAGKTTLLRAILGLLPAKGRSSLAQMPARARARQAAFMPQGREIAWPVSVADLVSLGRGPWQGTWRGAWRGGSQGGEGDQQATDRALARMGLTDFAARVATELSGGEQARVLLARALAQETPMLIADEPGAGLDPAAQIRMMQLMADLAAEGRMVMASVHDLGLAMRWATRLLVLHNGRIVADGPPRQVLTAELMAQVFGITAFITDTPQGPLFQPLGLI